MQNKEKFNYDILDKVANSGRKPKSRSYSSLRAVSMMTGILLTFRICSKTSKPSSPGIITSRMIRSKEPCPSLSRAVCPSAASAQKWESSSPYVRTSLRSLASSSTIKSFAMMHRSFCVLKDIKSIITRSFLDRKRSHKIFRFRRAEGSKSRFLRGKPPPDCKETARKTAAGYC